MRSDFETIDFEPSDSETIKFHGDTLLIRFQIEIILDKNQRVTPLSW